MTERSWRDDFRLWNEGQISIHEIERRLIAHGLSETEINELLPDLRVMKSLAPDE